MDQSGRRFKFASEKKSESNHFPAKYLSQKGICWPMRTQKLSNSQLKVANSPCRRESFFLACVMLHDQREYKAREKSRSNQFAKKICRVQLEESYSTSIS